MVVDKEKSKRIMVFWVPAVALVGSTLAVGADIFLTGGENFRWLIGVMTLAAVVLVYNAVTYGQR